MDFLRLISDDLQALRNETKKKYPVVREAVDKAAEAVPQLQKQYAAALRLDGAAPGPGHALFKSESVLRPFLLACNHTNASHKIIILALVSIQRLVSWDAIEQSSVGSILRVLQIQAEKNSHSDVQVKLLQTLLQLVTLGYEEKEPAAPLSTRTNSSSSSSTGPLSGLTLHANGSHASPAPPPPTVEPTNALVGSEDLVMQAIWICIHLHGASSGANSVVGNTAAMTIRQVVSLAFGKVHKSVEAKRVGVLVFQELCFLSREESGVWLKRTATSPMSAALSVELLETILSAHTALFRTDSEFYAVLKQHVSALLQTAMELGCGDKHANSSSSAGSGGSSSTNSLTIGGMTMSLPSTTTNSLSSSSSSNAIASNNSNGHSNGPFFPLLVRVMRLASVVLCNFSDVLIDECAVLFKSLLEVVATGAFYQPVGLKSPNHAKLTAQDVKTFLTHSSSVSGSSGGITGSGGSAGGSSSSSSSAANSVGSFVTWPVLLALEVLNRVCQEAVMVAALTHYHESIVTPIARTIASVITTSPPVDFRALQSSESATAPRSGLELLNEQDSPALQPFFSAIRVALTCQSNLVTSIFELSRSVDDRVDDDAAAIKTAARCAQSVGPLAPFVVHALNCTMRYCREVELITMSLKTYHVLATTASRLRATVERCLQSDSASDAIGRSDTAAAASSMDDVVLACLRALCAFSFPLPPDSSKSSLLTTTQRGTSISANMTTSSSNSNNNNGVSGTSASSSDALDDAVGDDGDSCVVVITWREVHAMKALFGAAHIMEEELTELEWCALLDGFEIVVGLADPKTKSGQFRIATRHYCIRAFHVEDEDVEQQLVMLAASIIEFVNGARRLSSSALRKLLSAVQSVCWHQLGLPLPSSGASGASVSTSTALLPTSHHMRIYQHFLGVGLTGSGAFTPCFALRMLTQLAASSKRSYEHVMRAFVRMTTVNATPASPLPQLHDLQVFTTDRIFQLLQDALLQSVNSLSPTTKAPSASSDDAVRQAFAHANVSVAHVFDQHELFAPLATLVRSDLRDRALVGVLDLLNACGHLIHAGWPLVLEALATAAAATHSTHSTHSDGSISGSGSVSSASDVARTQVLAFKCLRVIVDDLLVSIPRVYLPHCVTCIGRFATCAKDVNISLTAVNELWSVADIIGKQKARRPSQFDVSKPQQQNDDDDATYWICAFRELSAVALDDRTEVRNSALNTLFGTAVTYGAQFGLHEWQMFIDETVLPLAQQLALGRADSHSSSSSSTNNRTPAAATPTYVMHHSRDNVAKQWDESRVLLLNGISRVLQTNWLFLFAHTAWVARVWRALLAHVARSASCRSSKEVALAAIGTLQTMLQVASAGDFDQIASSQPVRAGAGMRVVGGALVASASSAASAGASSTNISSSVMASGTTKRAQAAASMAPLVRDPALWATAFDQLLRLDDDRYTERSSPPPSSSSSTSVQPTDDDAQEIASAVVAVLVTLYTQATTLEFRDVTNVTRLLDAFEVLLLRHVLCDTLNPTTNSKTLATITTNNSLQSRVLNAFEECRSFDAHPQVQTQALDQLVLFVTKAAALERVFVTRHALVALAKLYASVSVAARRARFTQVLFCIQPFLWSNVHSSSSEFLASSGSTTPTHTSSPAPSPNKLPSASQKAASQLWMHALRVLLVLGSHGLAAVQLQQPACWQPLLATINLVLQPGSGTFPSYARDSEEDQVLVLSVLECVVDSVLALLDPSHRGSSTSDDVDGFEANGPLDNDTTAFVTELLAMLCAGVDASRFNKLFVKCCVRQLATLSLQQSDADLAHLAQRKLVGCSSTALRAFAALEDNAMRTDSSTSSSSSRVEAALPAQLAAARERVVILLASACEVALEPRRVLELFPALCACITSADRDVRELIQRLLVHARVSEHCLELLDQAGAPQARSRYSPPPSSSSSRSLSHQQQQQ